MTKEHGTNEMIREIKISEIEIGDNHRKELDDAETAALAKSIERNGLQQPIRVCVCEKPGGGWTLVCGNRRFEAYKRLGRAAIPAVCSGPMTAAEIETARAVENFDRLDLSPLETARAVELMIGAKLVDLGSDTEVDASEGVPPAAIAWAADALGRSPTWVRDHLFLMRLEGKAREYTECGALPIRYARELAKLADGKLQSELAGRCFHGGGGWGQKPDLERLTSDFLQLRRWVSEAMNSLRSVPWDQSVPFAGKPACETCPSNSAVAASTGLFATEANPDGEDALPDNAACLNPACYAGKKNAVERLITTSITKNGEKIRALPAVTVAQLRAAKLIPNGVKESAFTGRARRSVEPANAPSRKTAAAAKPAARNAPEPHKTAVDKWCRHTVLARNTLEKELLGLAASDATVVWRVLASSLLPLSDAAVAGYHSAWNEEAAKQAVNRIRKEEKASQGSDVAAVVKMIAGGSDELIQTTIRAACAASLDELETKPGQRRGRARAQVMPTEFMMQMPEVSPAVVGRVLEALGLDDPYRTIDSFLQAEMKKAEPKAAAKPAGKKAAKKKTSKKAGKKKAARAPGKGSGHVE